MRILVAVVALLLAAPFAAAAQTPPVRVTNVTWSSGCVTRVGPPQVGYSPGNRVVSVLMQELRVEIQSQTIARRQSRTCRLTLAMLLPPKQRATFRAAQYDMAVMPSAGAQASVRIRHGVKRLWTRWSGAVLIEDRMPPATIERPPAPQPRSGCGGTARFTVELKLMATAPADAFALAEVDSIDLDTQVSDSLLLESC